MSDSTPDLKPASPIRKPARSATPARTSLIWLVPVIALIVTLGLAWNAFAGRGTLISVEFSDATGITPGETALKFREITVGKVESVRFTPNLQRVVVNIRVDKDVSKYIDSNAEFWIVRPQVSTQGIQRLDTVLTGAFIEGYWDDRIEEPQRTFVGLDRMPLTRVGEKGTWIILSSDNSKGLAEGAPVTYRGVQVGTMQNLRLGEDDETVLADVFIASPHDKRLTTATVFWDISGFSFSLGPQGVALNVASLASLLQGGVEFATLTSGGKPVPQGYRFELQHDEAAAKSSLFIDDEDLVRLTVLIDGTIKGLAKGADVKFQGLTVGRVTDLSVRVDPDAQGGAGSIHQQVAIALTPSRLGLPEGTTPEQTLDFLQKRVEHGMRARLASAGFFGTSLVVELADVPDAAPAEIDTTAQPYPILPSVPGKISDFSDTAQGFLARVGNLPIEEVLKSASDMMNSITAVTSSEDTRALPASLKSAVDEIQGAAAELRQATAELRQGGAIGQMRGFVDEATAAASAVKDAAADVPDMVDKINAAADSVYEFDFEGTSNEVKGILGDLRAMLGTDDAAQLPKNLSDVLKSASGLLNDLRDGNATGSLNELLKSAKVTSDQIAESVKQFPELTARINQLAARADQVIAAYGPRSDFNNETVNMMREFRRAATAVSSLANMIERNPRAFILGR
ncbi:PqiB family protein [Paracoccus aminophilus]|uniref:Paraquat-inducible protein B n=1 Tax=Paracoccus aminophilus JCM 7686 TaxID=1367847 RepID=S5Z1I4_PARAH|nr:MlaD family protein [Paracoccus aminophilus]AGT11306.1 paraquat-inducible protein B [Paracoccus aminophilus JCM 7686]